MHAILFLLRTKQSYIIENPLKFKQQLLHWSQQFDEIVWLDANNHKQKHADYDAILAVEAFTSIKTDAFEAFQNLEEK